MFAAAHAIDGIEVFGDDCDEQSWRDSAVAPALPVVVVVSLCPTAVGRIDNRPEEYRSDLVCEPVQSFGGLWFRIYFWLKTNRYEVRRACFVCEPAPQAKGWLGLRVSLYTIIRWLNSRIQA